MVRSLGFEPGSSYARISKSSIKFDMDRLAEFSEVEGVTYSDLSIEYKVALLYSRGSSFGNIEKELGIPRVYVKRNLMKVLKSWLGLQQ